MVHKDGDGPALQTPPKLLTPAIVCCRVLCCRTAADRLQDNKSLRAMLHIDCHSSWGVLSNYAELSAGAGGTFGRLTLFTTDSPQELLDYNHSKAHTPPPLVQAMPMCKQHPCPSNTHVQATPMAKQRPCPSNTHVQATLMSKQHSCPSNTHVQATPLSKQRPCPSNAHVQATPMSKQRPCPSNTHVQATPLSKQHSCPSNTLVQATPLSKQRPCPSNAHVQATPGVGSVNFGTVGFGGDFFNSFYQVPCVLPDTLVLRCTIFILCVKAALLANRAFVACFASWFSE